MENDALHELVLKVASHQRNVITRFQAAVRGHQASRRVKARRQQMQARMRAAAGIAGYAPASCSTPQHTSPPARAAVAGYLPSPDSEAVAGYLPSPELDEVVRLLRDHPIPRTLT